jgi:hypothetical protein
MGKLILCSGVRTNKPYLFEATGVRVYSMDELCYYLFHHVYFIEEAMFTNAFIEWIKTELKLPERADKIKLLKEQKADVKSIVTVILCSADYYTELEIKQLLKTLDEIIGMPLIKRNCIKANNLLYNKNYNEAAKEYERLLHSEEAIMLSPKEYGEILHNQAIAVLNVTGYREASEIFRQAYERNQREESLRQYLFTLKLSNNHELYEDKLKEYEVNEELQNRIENDWADKNREAQKSDWMLLLQQIINNKAMGNRSAFEKQTQELMNAWKVKARQF